MQLSPCSRKIYAPGDPSKGLKESILFLEIVYFLEMNSPKRRMRTRAAKTHKYVLNIEKMVFSMPAVDFVVLEEKTTEDN